MFDEYHFITEYGHGFHSDYNRLHDSVIGQFTASEPPCPLLLMFATNSKSINLDIYPVSKIRLEPEHFNGMDQENS